MFEDQEGEILELCHYINEKCEFDQQTFTFDKLTTPQWYLEIFSILCPYLEEEIQQIHSIPNSQLAINQILKLINSLDEFNEDVTELIHGRDIVNGNQEQILYMVQMFHTLIEAAIKEDGEIDSDGGDLKDEQNQDQFHSQSALKQQREQLKFERQNISSKKESIPSSQQKKFKKSVVPQIQQRVQEREIFSPIEFSDKTSSKKRNLAPFLTEQKKDISDSISEENPFSDSEDSKSMKNHDEAAKKKKKSFEKQKFLPSKNENIHIQKTMKKVKSAEDLKFRKHKQKIKPKVKRQKNLCDGRVKSPGNEKMLKKKKNQYINENKFRSKKIIQKNIKSDENFRKLLNWKQQNVKKQRRKYENSMRACLQFKKQVYLTKANNMILKLEKEKQTQQKKEFQKNLLQSNNQAVRRLVSLQRWYKDQIEIAEKDKKKRKNQQKIIQTGHRQIVKQLQNKLKKGNEKKLLTLAQQLRQEQMEINADLEELQMKIMKGRRN